MKQWIKNCLFFMGLIMLLLAFYFCAFPTYYRLNDNKRMEIIPEEEVVLAYQDEMLKGSDPIVEENMIPVYYDEETKSWYKANINEKWYDYINNWWANIVVVKPEYLEDYKKMDANSVIEFAKIYGFFVWVPRFEYKLFNVNNELSKEQMIDVNMVSVNEPKKEVIENGLYYTHPAFTANYSDGSKYELSGFWIAKFEPSLTNDGQVLLLPNQHPLVNINMSKMWEYATSLSQMYQLKTPSRIITNMEWGAIAYFSFSKYGKIGNVKYENMEKRLFINNSRGNESWNNLVTGCSSGTVNWGAQNGCQYLYDELINGTGASSTGNIYGIYDLVGGAWECVMGLVSSENPQNNIGGYNGTPPQESRYYTFYSNGSMDNATRGHIGDATRETKTSNNWNASWYGNLSYFAYSNSPWIKRGGSFRGGGYSGLFDYGVTNAHERKDKTFRTILSVY